MNNELQELMNFLSANHKLTLTSILSGTNADTWEQNRHIILSSTPFLTLEMAVSRVSINRVRDSTPEPQHIYDAIKYASRKRQEYMKSLDEPLKEKDNAA